MDVVQSGDARYGRLQQGAAVASRMNGLGIDSRETGKPSAGAATQDDRNNFMTLQLDSKRPREPQNAT